MSAFWLELTLSNVCVSAALALVAFAVHRGGRHPFLAHALWLGVLLKLVTPPVITVPLIPFESPASTAELALIEEQLTSLRTSPISGWAGRSGTPQPNPENQDVSGCRRSRFNPERTATG